MYAYTVHKKFILLQLTYNIKLYGNVEYQNDTCQKLQRCN